jgi:hypothetical protein
MFENKGAADSAIHHPPIEVGVFLPAAQIKSSYYYSLPA